ncbi:unnamed protein product, partial [Heterotrigona itama]
TTGPTGDTGGIILKVPGESSAEKADNLAGRMRQVFSNNGDVKVSRPRKMAEVRISGLGYIGSDQGRRIRRGGCEDRRNPPMHADEHGSVWVRCSATAARKIAMIGRLLVGWVLTRVEALDKRPLQCFRCMEMGHTAPRCSSETDSSRRCYRCGTPGHFARNCTAPVKCPLCADMGRPSPGQ